VKLGLEAWRKLTGKESKKSVTHLDESDSGRTAPKSLKFLIPDCGIRIETRRIDAKETAELSLNYSLLDARVNDTLDKELLKRVVTLSTSRMQIRGLSKKAEKKIGHDKNCK
jgi:hypothetical protein